MTWKRHERHEEIRRGTTSHTTDREMHEREREIAQ